MILELYSIKQKFFLTLKLNDISEVVLYAKDKNLCFVYKNFKEQLKFETFSFEEISRIARMIMEFIDESEDMEDKSLLINIDQFENQLIEERKWH